MSVNDRIVESIYAAIRSEVAVPRIEGGWCLRTVRKVLEHALGWEDEELFKRFPNKIETKRPHPRPYFARDIQRSLRDADWGVPLAEAQPGDVLAYWKAAPNEYGDYVGHIGIVAYGGFVFENINPAYRAGWGAFSSGALSLTPLALWVDDKDVEAFRVPEGLA